MKVNKEKYEEGLALLKKISTTYRSDGPGRKDFQLQPKKDPSGAQPVPNPKRRKTFMEYAEQISLENSNE